MHSRGEELKVTVQMKQGQLNAKNHILELGNCSGVLMSVAGPRANLAGASAVSQPRSRLLGSPWGVGAPHWWGGEGHVNFPPSSLALRDCGVCDSSPTKSRWEELIGREAGDVYSYLFSALLHGIHALFVFVFTPHNYSSSRFVSLPEEKSILVQLPRFRPPG